jgi:hypothetical protein
LAHKLKTLKANLRVWNEQVFGNVENQKRLLLDKLRVFDGLVEERTLCDEEKLRKDRVICDLERAILLEEMSWLREGDRCTKFFRRVVNLNRRNKSIESLLVNGPVTFDHTEIKEHIAYDDCLPNSLVGDPSWMAFHLIPLMRRKLLG